MLSLLDMTKTKSLDSELEPCARYRCMQRNLSRANDTILFTSETYTQYLLSRAGGQPPVFHVDLEDFVNETNPKSIELAFAVVEQLERLKNNVSFTQDRQGAFVEIRNMDRLTADWNSFKTERLDGLEFYIRLREANEDAAADIVEAGDIEFASATNLMTTLSKNLFYHVLLRANAGQHLEKYQIRENSMLFPELQLTTNVEVRGAGDAGADDDIITIELVGAVEEAELPKDEIRAWYDKIYRSFTKYEYSEYARTFSIEYDIDRRTGLLVRGAANICEGVKDNYEVSTHFKVRMLDI